MFTRVIGIDCATDPAKTGLALGAFENGRVSVEVARVCGRREDPSDAVCGWLAAAQGRKTLIAVDAPLGWPTAMGAFLSRHSAGQGLDVDPKTMFRRMTDIRVRMATGKTPLDVGADRIARTAHSALALLQLIRELTGLEIPLAWTTDFEGCAAIEVYPAATLKAHGLRCAGYKTPGGAEARREMLAGLGPFMALPEDLRPSLERADALDACVCLLAAADFLTGSAMPPPEAGIARKEGWIWVRGHGA